MGLPTIGVHSIQYGRDVAPEMLLESSYFQFHVDIGSWVQCSSQFWGYVCSCCFQSTCCITIHQHLDSLSPSLVKLFNAMCSDNPLSQPLASELLKHIWGLDISQETLMARVPHSILQPTEESGHVGCTSSYLLSSCPLILAGEGHFWHIRVQQ